MILPSNLLLSSTLTSTSRGCAPTRCALPSWLVGRAIPFSFCGRHDGHFSVFSRLIFQILQSRAAVMGRRSCCCIILMRVLPPQVANIYCTESAPNANHLNGSRSSRKIYDAHLRMSLRDMPCASADSGKSPFRGRLRRRPWACEKFRGYRGLAPLWIGFG